MAKTTESHLETRGDLLFYRGIPVREMLAYPIPVVCKLLGVSRWTLWREVSFKRIRMTRFKRIAKIELDRYLAEVVEAESARVPTHTP